MADSRNVVWHEWKRGKKRGCRYAEGMVESQDDRPDASLILHPHSLGAVRDASENPPSFPQVFYYRPAHHLPANILMLGVIAYFNRT